MIKSLFSLLLALSSLTSNAASQSEKIMEFKWQQYNAPLSGLSTSHHYLSLNETSLIGVSKADGKLKVWSTKASAAYAQMTSIALSPSGKQVAAVNEGCQLSLFDEESGTETKFYSSEQWGACIGAEISVHFLTETEVLLRYENLVKIVDLNATETNYNLNYPTYSFDRIDRKSALIIDPASETFLIENGKYNGPCSLRKYEARSGQMISEQSLSKCVEISEPALASDRLLASTFVDRNADGTIVKKFEYLDLADLQFKAPITLTINVLESVTPLDADRFILSSLKNCTLKIFSFNVQQEISKIPVGNDCHAVTSVSVDPISKEVLVSGMFAGKIGQRTEAVARMYRLSIH